MSTGLLNQLESYFSDVDTGQGPVSPDRVAELIDQVRELPTPVPVRNRPPVWVAAAAFAIVLVLVGGLVLLAPFGGDSVAPSDQQEPTVPPTSPPPTTAVSEADALRDESDRTESDNGPIPGLTSGVVWTEVTDSEAGNPIAGPGIESSVGMIALFGDSYVVPQKVCRLGDCSWLISDDGLEWRTEPVPVEPPDGDTEYRAWVADEKVWFFEEWLEDAGGNDRTMPIGIADRVDPPGHLKVLHNEGTSWIETRWVPPAGAEDGLSILASRGMGTCLMSLSDEGIVFDIGYRPADGDAKIILIQDGDSRAIPHPGDPNQTCVAGFVNRTLYALASSTDGQNQSQHFWRWNGDSWSRLPDPEGVGATVPIDTAGGTRPPRFTTAAIGGGRAFVEVSDGKMWTTTDFETWDLTDGPQDSDPAGDGIRTWAMRPTDFGWIAPSKERSTSAYATTNGITWHAIETPKAALESFSYVNGVFAFATDNAVWAGVPSTP